MIKQIYKEMSSSQQIVSQILATNYSNTQRKLVSLPLQFGDLPVDILAKQFTKLNSPHPHRIHFLGPRFVNTQHLHKKYAFSQANPICLGAPHRSISKYHLDYKKIVTSFSVNERLRSNHHYKTGLYYRAFQGMNPTLDLQTEYVFDSTFQSGNLDCVIQYKPREFDCFLRIDSNTRGHVQWYYFSIKNGNLLEKIKINICNITKPKTLYEQGMQPYFYSKKENEGNKVGWKQGHSNLTGVTFQQKRYNYTILQGKIPDKSPYCLSFDYQFTHTDDQVFFAYCIPYTYSQMIKDISSLPIDCCQIITFAKSLSGVDIPLLIISDKTTNDDDCKLPKKNIFITGRIHPGETNGSHMMTGFLEYICSNDQSAITLRKRTNFFIIPMLNPDGVILGNSRSSVAGKDLNRVFPFPNQQIYPQAFQLRHMISLFSKHKRILMYFDFHGHSRRKNTFFYGPSYSLTHPNYYKARVLPKIIQAINNSFRFHSCTFTISENKKTTARACMFQTFNIPFTFTVESSIGFQYDCEKLKTFAFDCQRWITMGSNICEGLALYIEAYEEYEQFMSERKELREKKRADRILISRKSIKNSEKLFFDDEEQDYQNTSSNKSPLKLRYKNVEEGLFIKMIKEIKKSDENIERKLTTSQGEREREKQKQKNAQEEASSDDHDENEDLEASKMKELNYLISECGDRKEKKQKRGQEQSHFVRSKNLQMTIKFNKVSEENEEDEMNFLQENILRKIKSSHSNQRPRFSPLKMRSQTRKLVRREVIKTNSMNQSSSNETSLLAHAKMNINSANDDFRKMYKDDPATTTRSYRTKNKTFQINFKKNDHNMTRFSQIQFPNQQPETESSQKPGTSKGDIFRRVRRIRNSKQTSSKPISSLKCTQMMIQRQKEERSAQMPKREIKTKNIEFTIEQLMNNLENRSKMLKSSVKYKQPEKVKQKNNFIFPSSFHGIKNQVSIKRQFKTREQTPIVRDKPKRISIDNLAFEVRHYHHPE